MVRLNLYCRIEAASANPIQTELDPAARTAGPWRARRSPARLRRAGIGDDHRGIGPIMAGAPAHTTSENPVQGCPPRDDAIAESRKSFGAAVRSPFRPKSIEYRRPPAAKIQALG
jgi:hypothetical protein